MREVRVSVAEDIPGDDQQLVFLDRPVNKGLAGPPGRFRKHIEGPARFHDLVEIAQAVHNHVSLPMIGLDV